MQDKVNEPLPAEDLAVLQQEQAKYVAMNMLIGELNEYAERLRMELLKL